MQRRDQQRRAASIGGSLNSSDPSYLGVGGGGISGCSPIPRFELVEPSLITRGTTFAVKSPPFKGSGMKLCVAKKTKQAELLDALGVEERTTNASSERADDPESEWEGKCS